MPDSVQTALIPPQNHGGMEQASTRGNSNQHPQHLCVKGLLKKHRPLPQPPFFMQCRPLEKQNHQPDDCGRLMEEEAYNMICRFHLCELSFTVMKTMIMQLWSNPTRKGQIWPGFFIERCREPFAPELLSPHLLSQVWLFRGHASKIVRQFFFSFLPNSTSRTTEMNSISHPCLKLGLNVCSVLIHFFQTRWCRVKRIMSQSPFLNWKKKERIKSDFLFVHMQKKNENRSSSIFMFVLQIDNTNQQWLKYETNRLWLDLASYPWSCRLPSRTLFLKVDAFQFRNRMVKSLIITHRFPPPPLPIRDLLSSPHPHPWWTACLSHGHWLSTSYTLSLSLCKSVAFAGHFAPSSRLQTLPHPLHCSMAAPWV